MLFSEPGSPTERCAGSFSSKEKAVFSASNTSTAQPRARSSAASERRVRRLIAHTPAAPLAMRSMHSASLRGAPRRRASVSGAMSASDTSAVAISPSIKNSCARTAGSPPR